MIFLHSVLFSMSFSLGPTSPISSFITSKNLLFGLPLFLFPGNSISITLLPIYSWSLLMTCRYRLSLPSLIFIPNRSTLTVPLMYSFLIILSFFVTPIANSTFSSLGFPSLLFVSLSPPPSQVHTSLLVSHH